MSAPISKYIVFLQCATSISGTAQDAVTQHFLAASRISTPLTVFSLYSVSRKRFLLFFVMPVPPLAPPGVGHSSKQSISLARLAYGASTRRCTRLIGIMWQLI